MIYIMCIGHYALKVESWVAVFPHGSYTNSQMDAALDPGVSLLSEDSNAGLTGAIGAFSFQNNDEKRQHKIGFAWSL